MRLNFTPFPQLETERLCLRRLELSDAPAVFAYQSDKRNFPYVDMPVFAAIEEAVAYINRMNSGIDQDKWIIWAITRKDSGAVVGTISLWGIEAELSRAELGYGLFPGHSGQGYMAEALGAVVDYGFTGMGLQLLEAYTNIQNHRSSQLLERVGFTLRGTVQDTHTHSGTPMEMAVFQRTAE